MPGNDMAQQKQEYGNYLWRGGKKIPLEKVEDRFTVTPRNKDQVERLRHISGVRAVKPVTAEVYKVETSATDRDSAMEMARSESMGSIAHHAYRPTGTEGTMYYLTDAISVRFSPGAPVEEINSILDRYQLRVIREFEGIENTYLVQVTSGSGENPIKVANRLAEEKLVQYAEPNLVNRYKRAYVPKDTYFKKQWHLSSTAGPQLEQDACVQACGAWDITRGDRSITVCVIDDGFDLTHPDFKGQDKIVAPTDYADDDTRPLPEGGDYHGTPCAGVAIAESNGKGVVGAAPGCSFMPVRFPLTADDALLATIFTEAAAHADVISCSWGPPPAYAPMSSVIYDLFTEITSTGGPRGKGCVLCFAAGNWNAPINDPVNEDGVRWFDGERIRWTFGPIQAGEATHPGVIAVAASTSLNKHAAYSSWGKEISVCSPSDNFDPIYGGPLPGLGIWTTDNHRYGQGFTEGRRYTGEFGGTSSATPLVAGIAALVLSANPHLTASEVKQILESTADRITDEDSSIYGEGKGLYGEDGHSDWFGYGKVNAGKAVEEAKSRIGT